MKEFQAGDRVVKMSGVAAGKYGTVNSVLDNGTLNVTFDGERRPRYCDPERCGQVATNAKFKVGDRVAYYGKEPAIYRLRGKVSDVSRIRGETFVTVDLDNGEEWGAPEKDWAFMNAARNATARNAGRFELVEHNMGRSFGVYDSATKGYIADDIPLRDALRILKTKGETAEQAKKGLDWVSPSAVDKLW